MQETRVQSLGQEDPLEKKTETCSSILAWKIAWTEERGGHSPRGCETVGRYWGTKRQQQQSRLDKAGGTPGLTSRMCVTQGTRACE